MKRFRFIHTADLHLDTPFTGLKKLPESIHDQIKQSTFSALEQIVDLCITRQVDFLVIAGDVFDLEDRSLRAQIALRNQLERLSDHNIYTYIIHGNHDPNDQVKAWMNWPEKVHIFSEKEVESVVFSKADVEMAVILGQSYPTKDFKEQIVHQYQRDLKKEIFHIGILHTNLDGNKEHDSYAPSRLKDLIEQDMDYWALGHIHKGKIISEQKPYVVYAGNPQGRNKKEHGKKGCYLIDVYQNEIEKIEWLETSQIIWEEIEIDISHITQIPELLEQIEEQLEISIEQWNKPLILQVYLKGETTLHFELSHDDKLEELKEWINGRYDKALYWYYIDQLHLETTAIGIEESIEKGTFLGDYLDQLDLFLEENKDEAMRKGIFEELFKKRGFKAHLPNDFQVSSEQLTKETRNLIYHYFAREDARR